MTEGQTNYVRYLLPVFETGSRISEGKLTSKSLRKGSTECTKDVWPPVEQMSPRISRMGARDQTESRNMAVVAEIKSSTPASYSSPLHVSSRLAANKLFRFLLLVFKPQFVFRRQN